MLSISFMILTAAAVHSASDNDSSMSSSEIMKNLADKVEELQRLEEEVLIQRDNILFDPPKAEDLLEKAFDRWSLSDHDNSHLVELTMAFLPKCYQYEDLRGWAQDLGETFTAHDLLSDHPSVRVEKMWERVCKVDKELPEVYPRCKICEFVNFSKSRQHRPSETCPILSSWVSQDCDPRAAFYLGINENGTKLDLRTVESRLAQKAYFNKLGYKWEQLVTPTDFRTNLYKHEKFLRNLEEAMRKEDPTKSFVSVFPEMEGLRTRGFCWMFFQLMVLDEQTFENATNPPARTQSRFIEMIEWSKHLPRTTNDESWIMDAVNLALEFMIADKWNAQSFVFEKYQKALTQLKKIQWVINLIHENGLIDVQMLKQQSERLDSFKFEALLTGLRRTRGGSSQIRFDHICKIENAIRMLEPSKPELFVPAIQILKRKAIVSWVTELKTAHAQRSSPPETILDGINTAKQAIESASTAEPLDSWGIGTVLGLAQMPPTTSWAFELDTLKQLRRAIKKRKRPESNLCNVCPKRKKCDHPLSYQS